MHRGRGRGGVVGARVRLALTLLLALLLLPVCAFWTLLLALWARAGFYNTTPIVKPAVTGSRGGNAALASVLTALANLGLITNSSTA